MSKKKVTRKVVVGKKGEKSGATRTVATRPKDTPSTARRRISKVSKTEPMMFGRQNYLLMLAGIALVALGLIAMLGGDMPDPNTWDPDIIYSKRITVLGPVLILSGLVVEIFAIFRK